MKINHVSFVTGFACLIVTCGCSDLPNSTSQLSVEINQPQPSMLQAEMNAKERILMRMKIAELEEPLQISENRSKPNDPHPIYVDDENLEAVLGQLALNREADSKGRVGPLNSKTLPSQELISSASTQKVDQINTEISVRPQDSQSITGNLEHAIELGKIEGSNGNQAATNLNPSTPPITNVDASPGSTERAEHERVKPKNDVITTPVISATGRENPYPLKEAYDDKQRRLRELLELYKADKITPGEYHRERNKIVADTE